MNRSFGHRYRFWFASFCWSLLIVGFVLTPNHSSAISKAVFASMALLVMSFTIVTFVMWRLDKPSRH